MLNASLRSTNSNTHANYYTSHVMLMTRKEREIERKEKLLCLSLSHCLPADKPALVIIITSFPVHCVLPEKDRERRGRTFSAVRIISMIRGHEEERPVGFGFETHGDKISGSGFRLIIPGERARHCVRVFC